MAIGPTQRSRVIGRKVTDTTNVAGRGSAALAEGLGSMQNFFSQTTKLQKAKLIAENDEAAKREFAAISTKLSADPKGALEAARTGDYSKYSQYEISSHAMLGVAVPKFVGSLLAQQDRTVIEQKLNEADPSLPGSALVAKHSEETLKGMNPHAAAAYTKQVGEYTPSLIKSRRDAINKVQYSKFKEDLVPATEAMLSSGRLETLADFRAAAVEMGSITTSFGQNALQGGLEAEEIMRSVIMKIAQSPSFPPKEQARAMRLMLERDPKTGLSMANRYSEQATKIKDELLGADKKFRSVAGQRVVQEHTVRFAAINDDDVDGLTKNWARFSAEFKAVGGNENASGYVSLQTQIAKKLAKAAGNNLAVSEFVNLGTLRNADAKKDIIDGKNTPREIVKEAERKYGGTPKSNSLRSTRMRDVNNILAVQEELIGLTSNNPAQGISDFVSPGDASLARAALSLSKEELPVLWPTILDNYTKLETVNRDHPFQSMSREDSILGSGRATEGQRGEKDAAIEVWKNAGKEFRAQFGEEGLLWGRNAPSYGELPSVVKSEITSALNTGALLYANVPNARERAIEFAKQRLTDKRFTIAREGDNNVPTFRDTKNKWAPLTPEVSDKMHAALVERNEEAGIDIGVGFREDSLTRTTGSYQVTVENAAGIFTPLAMSPGKHEIPNSLMNSEFYKYFEKVGPGKNNSTIIIVPEPEVNPDDMTQTVARWMDTSPRNALTDQASTGWAYKPSSDQNQRGQWHARVRPSVADAPPGFLERLLGPKAPKPMREDLDQAAREAKRAKIKTKSDEQQGAFVVGDLAAPPAPPFQNVVTKPLEQKDDGVDELVKDQLLAGGVAEGSINPRAAAAVRESDDFKTSTPAEVYAMADKLTKEQGGYMALGPDFSKNSSEFIIAREVGTQPYKATAYPDPFTDPKTGKLNNAKSIGYGFNLANKNADAMLKAVGAPTKKELLAGARITETQAVALTQFMIDKNVQWLLKHFEGVAMPQNRWIALASLAYNSKWTDKGPTLIGPNLTKYIKAGQWDKAEDEIRYRSGKVDNPAFKEGIRLRRELEANLFRGSK